MKKKKDNHIIELIKKLRTSIHRKLGTKMCKELNEDCIDCRMRILIAYLNSAEDIFGD